MAISPEVHSTPDGFDPPGAAAVVSEEIAAFFSAEVPAGSETELLDRATRLGRELDQARMSLVLRLARLQDSGVLLEHGGQRSLAAWMMQSFGLGRQEATALARVALCFHRQELPDTTQEFWAGFISLGEAAAIARAVERETKKRDAEPRNRRSPRLP